MLYYDILRFSIGNFYFKVYLVNLHASIMYQVTMNFLYTASRMDKISRRVSLTFQSSTRGPCCLLSSMTVCLITERERKREIHFAQEGSHTRGEFNFFPNLKVFFLLQIILQFWSHYQNFVKFFSCFLIFCSNFLINFNDFFGCFLGSQKFFNFYNYSLNILFFFCRKLFNFLYNI